MFRAPFFWPADAKTAGEIGGRCVVDGSTLNCSTLNSQLASVCVDFGDAETLEALGVILAVEDVPLLAAFEDFLLLRGDLGAHFGIDLLFELQ